MGKYLVEVSREQHTSIYISANNADEALIKAEDLYSCDKCLLDALEWYDYDKGISFEVVEE